MDIHRSCICNGSNFKHPHIHRVDGGRHCGVSLWSNTVLPWKGRDSWHVRHHEGSVTEWRALRQAKQKQYIPYDFTDPTVEKAMNVCWPRAGKWLPSEGRGEGQAGEVTVTRTLWDNGYVHYFDCGDGFVELRDIKTYHVVHFKYVRFIV